MTHLAITSDEDMAARTAFGEARGESPLAILYVLCCIRNRLESGRWYGGENVEEVVMCREQFSCWNPGDPNRQKCLHAELIDEKAWSICCGLAVAVMRAEACPVPGITHYHDTSIPPPKWTNPPAEYVSLPGEGRLRFYKGVA